MKKTVKITALLTAVLMMCSVFPSAAFAWNASELTRGSGDVNGNGWIDIFDARLALRFAVNFEEPSEEQKKSADADGNGVISVSDARCILRFSLGLDECDIPIRALYEFPEIKETETVRDVKQAYEDGYSGFYITAERTEKNEVQYFVHMKNYIGATAFQLKIGYDADKFEFLPGKRFPVTDGELVKLVNEVGDTCWIAANGEKTGELTVAGVFADALKSTAEYNAVAKEPLTVKTEDITVCGFKLKELLPGTTKNVHFTLEGAIATEDGITGSKLDIVVDYPPVVTEPIEPEKPTEPCTHICHSTNKLYAMLWKFVCMLFNLFGVEKYCSCGAKHW